MREPTRAERQFRADFEGWCLYVGAPVPTAYIVLAEETPDRCLFAASEEFMAWLVGATRKKHLRKWTLGIGRHRPFGQKTARRGWRSVRLFYSVQMVEHDGSVIEADVDVFNPAIRGGIAMPILHLVSDVLIMGLRRSLGRSTGRVSPYDVAEAFRRDGIEVEEV